MHDDLNSEHILRYSTLLSELVLMNLLTLLFVWLGWYCPQSHRAMLQMIVVSTLSYTVCNIGSGVVTHLPWSRADQVIKHVLRNVCCFAVLQTLLNMALMVRPCKTWTYVIYYVILLAIVMLNRLAWRRLLQMWRRKSSHLCKVVFVGQLDNARELANAMFGEASGYKVLGYFADEEDIGAKIHEVAYLGLPSQAEQWIANHEGEVDELYCTLSSQREEGAAILRTCENHLVRFYVIPSARSYMNHRMNFDTKFNVPVLSLRNEPLSIWGNRAIKRLFDLLCSITFLCTIFPFLYVILGIAIKMSSPGPIFFKQKRSGQDGRDFLCYKFRSMRMNNDSDKLQATKDDPRKTRIGEFMRHTNLDEFPQFINVLRGEMSMVGPRPHMLKHTEMYSKAIDKYMVRHFVKPGITGWAQVTGYRGETRELWQMEGRVEKDIWYIEHWNFALDLYIIYKTFANVVIGDKSAY